MKYLYILMILLFSFDVSAYGLMRESNGSYVRWNKSYIVITLDSTLLELGDEQTVEKVIELAFDPWIYSTNLPISYRLEWKDCSGNNYDGDNCIFACGEKFHCNEKIKDCSTTYPHVMDGIIREVDILIDAVNWGWRTVQDGGKGLSLERVLEHEFGHFLGIGHSKNEKAIMYPVTYERKTYAKEIHEDDVEAIEFLYGDMVESSIPGALCSVVNISSDYDNVFDIFKIILSL